MSEIRMPSLGADMEAGTLLEWRVAIGDHVSRGDVVGLIETQKATMELESFVDGVVEALLVAPGDNVSVGTVLARLGGGPTHATPRITPIAAPPVAPPAVAPPAVAPPIAAATPIHVRSSPSARKRARELDIDLTTLHGTGPHGAIVFRDVVARSIAPSVTPSIAPSIARSVPPPVAPAIATQDVVAAPPALPARTRRTSSPSAVRDAIAAAMSRSKREIPHFYLSHTISLKRALAWLSDTNRERAIQQRILPGALLLRAVTLALWDFPELNGFYVDGVFQPAEEVHLGTAISLRTGGLVAPAILDADSISLDELMHALQDLVVRARGGHLRSSELTSATITVTSLGDRGCETVVPVINPPQVAIVGFGAILQRPWVDGETVVPHPTVVVALAADHRVCDGHRGGLFLSTIDRLLQEPTKL